MNKKILALSVAAALGSGASAVHATPGNDWMGSALVVPYYSVQNGNATLINLVNNDTVNGKAVKIRFRGAERSDDIFDFQVFLSPGDVWTAAVSQAADGRAQLATSDKSCTLPANVNQPFVTARLTGTDAQKAAGTREGYVEIINMGDILDATRTIAAFGGGAGVSAATDPDVVARQALFTATKHVNGVAPCTAGVLETVVNRAVSNTSSVTGLEAGTQNTGRLGPFAGGGLWANTTIINVNEAAAWSVSAVPAYWPGTGGTIALATRYWSQTGVSFGTNSGLTNQQVRNALYQVTLDGIFLGGSTLPAQYDFPDLSTPRDVAATLLRQSPMAWYLATNNSIGTLNLLHNEYITDDSILAQTDWVMSMPTRRYAIEGRNVAWPVSAQANLNYYEIPAVAIGATATIVGGIGIASVPDAYGSAANIAAANETQYYINSYLAPFRNTYNAALNCVNVNSFVIYDREEQTTSTQVVISPGNIDQLRLCGEVGVVSFNNAGAAATGALGAMLTVNNANLPYADGFATINFNVAASGGVPAGLPVIGNAYVKANNGGTGATNMNFGGVWKHRR